ncbi:AP2 domain transcription factor ap2ix-6 [Cyclospora cayetanensis]|uniref:AP2 domain transcription factor ap2ix-6 n=1 Tax=Cyclospora cayetanensis TaxID=88456 RepID=A0A1D3D5I3_9EIME|nr:AP2 domain transcription factor ap2ix-6 [Cyclospora cayetanensis]
MFVFRPPPTIGIYGDVSSPVAAQAYGLLPLLLDGVRLQAPPCYAESSLADAGLEDKGRHLGGSPSCGGASLASPLVGWPLAPLLFLYPGSSPLPRCVVAGGLLLSDSSRSSLWSPVPSPQHWVSIRAFGGRAGGLKRRKRKADPGVLQQSGRGHRMEFFWPRKQRLLRVPLQQNSRPSLIYDLRFRRFLCCWTSNGQHVFRPFNCRSRGSGRDGGRGVLQAGAAFGHSCAGGFEGARAKSLVLLRQLQRQGKLTAELASSKACKPEINRSGVRGVYFEPEERLWVAVWKEAGVRRFRAFSAVDLGFDTAYQAAVAGCSSVAASKCLLVSSYVGHLSIEVSRISPLPLTEQQQQQRLRLNDQQEVQLKNGTGSVTRSFLRSPPQHHRMQQGTAQQIRTKTKDASCLVGIQQEALALHCKETPNVSVRPLRSLPRFLMVSLSLLLNCLWLEACDLHRYRQYGISIRPLRQCLAFPMEGRGQEDSADLLGRQREARTGQQHQRSTRQLKGSICALSAAVALAFSSCSARASCPLPRRLACSDGPCLRVPCWIEEPAACSGEAELAAASTLQPQKLRADVSPSTEQRLSRHQQLFSGSGSRCCRGSSARMADGKGSTPSESGDAGEADKVFVPQLSERELRKIRYYEAMFAKMAAEEQQRRAPSGASAASTSATAAACSGSSSATAASSTAQGAAAAGHADGGGGRAKTERSTAASDHKTSSSSSSSSAEAPHTKRKHSRIADSSDEDRRGGAVKRSTPTSTAAAGGTKAEPPGSSSSGDSSSSSNKRKAAKDGRDAEEGAFGDGGSSSAVSLASAAHPASGSGSSNSNSGCRSALSSERHASLSPKRKSSTNSSSSSSSHASKGKSSSHSSGPAAAPATAAAAASGASSSHMHHGCFSGDEESGATSTSNPKGGGASGSRNSSSAALKGSSGDSAAAAAGGGGGTETSGGPLRGGAASSAAAEALKRSARSASTKSGAHGHAGKAMPQQSRSARMQPQQGLSDVSPGAAAEEKEQLQTGKAPRGSGFDGGGAAAARAAASGRSDACVDTPSDGRNASLVARSSGSHHSTTAQGPSNRDRLCGASEGGAASAATSSSNAGGGGGGVTPATLPKSPAREPAADSSSNKGSRRAERRGFSALQRAEPLDSAAAGFHSTTTSKGPPETAASRSLEEASRHRSCTDGPGGSPTSRFATHPSEQQQQQQSREQSRELRNGEESTDTTSSGPPAPLPQRRTRASPRGVASSGAAGGTDWSTTPQDCPVERRSSRREAFGSRCSAASAGEGTSKENSARSSVPLLSSHAAPSALLRGLLFVGALLQGLNCASAAAEDSNEALQLARSVRLLTVQGKAGEAATSSTGSQSPSHHYRPQDQLQQQLYQDHLEPERARLLASCSDVIATRNWRLLLLGETQERQHEKPEPTSFELEGEAAAEGVPVLSLICPSITVGSLHQRQGYASVGDQRKTLAEATRVVSSLNALRKKNIKEVLPIMFLEPAATKTSAVERTAADDDTPAAGWKGTSPPSCALQYDHDQQNSSPAGSFVVIQALPPDPLPTSTPLETPQHATHGVGSKGKQHEAADLELLLQQLSWALPQQQPSGRESSGETALGDGSDGADIVREQPLSAVAGGTALQTSPCGGFEAEEAHEALPLALLTLLEEHDRQATIAASEADKQALKRMRPAWLQRQLAAIREKTSVSAALRETPASRNASDTTTSDQPSAASALRSHVGAVSSNNPYDRPL